MRKHNISALFNLVEKLARKLGNEKYQSNEYGVYNISFDDVEISLYESHGVIIAESIFDALFLETDITKKEQQECMESIMQSSLIEIRNNETVLSISSQNNLCLFQKFATSIIFEEFYTSLNSFINLAEKYLSFTKNNKSNTLISTQFL